MKERPNIALELMCAAAEATRASKEGEDVVPALEKFARVAERYGLGVFDSDPLMLNWETFKSVELSWFCALWNNLIQEGKSQGGKRRQVITTNNQEGKKP